MSDILESKRRRELRRQLKYGDLTKIAEITGVSIKTVDRWLANSSESSVVETAINELLSARLESIKAKAREVA